VWKGQWKEGVKEREKIQMWLPGGEVYCIICGKEASGIKLNQPTCYWKENIDENP
jgi:hypothetical protein